VETGQIHRQMKSGTPGFNIKSSRTIPFSVRVCPVCSNNRRDRALLYSICAVYSQSPVVTWPIGQATFIRRIK